MDANATTPAVITINPNRELRKDQWKEMALQQQSHIGLLMKRLEMEKDMYSSMFHEKLEQEKELEALRRLKCQDELKSEIEELKKEVRDLTQEKEELADYYDKTYPIVDALRDELAEIKENRFPCDVYWSAINGDITLYKIPNEIGCLNTTDGDNAVLEAFQMGHFGEEWGSYSSLSVVEMTEEMLEEHVGELVEKEEESTPKSTKDLVIDQLNEEPHSPVVYLESAPIPELVEGGERRFTITETPAFEPLHEDATHQVVRGFFGVEFVWKVPAGINLRDTDTYEFGDKWGCLYISNKITGEEFEIEDRDEEDDFKRAHTLEVEDRDDDNNTY